MALWGDNGLVERPNGHPYFFLGTVRTSVGITSIGPLFWLDRILSEVGGQVNQVPRSTGCDSGFTAGVSFCPSGNLYTGYFSIHILYVSR